MKLSQGEATAVDPQYGVGVPPRQEVMFADGSAVVLHRVERNGAPDLFERRIQQGAEWLRIDLRELAPNLAIDLPISSTRDVPGTVFYSLRQRFKSTSQLLQSVAGGAPC